MDDIRARRLIPPSVRRFLADPRIDPLTRAFLTGLAGKPNEDWTVRDLQMMAAIIPALTEMRISVAILGEFYSFMGLDPTSLFEPQLGVGWQTTTATPYDPRNRFRRNSRCVQLSFMARSDADSVRMQELLTCED